MAAKIAVIDYGVGNLMSVVNALNYIGYEGTITANKDEIESAGAVILPGVGAFPDAASCLSSSELDKVVIELAEKKPLLGICVGMQLLFSSGTEIRQTPGLGLIKGEVDRIDTCCKLPQIGWNALEIVNPCALTRGITGGEYVYFVHSYSGCASDKADISCVTDYGTEVTAMVARGNVFGCQFHPEKSGDVGLSILKNFCELA